jgi:hypothetical protein
MKIECGPSEKKAGDDSESGESEEEADNMTEMAHKVPRFPSYFHITAIDVVSRGIRERSRRVLQTSHIGSNKRKHSTAVDQNAGTKQEQPNETEAFSLDLFDARIIQQCVGSHAESENKQTEGSGTEELRKSSHERGDGELRQSSRRDNGVKKSKRRGSNNDSEVLDSHVRKAHKKSKGGKHKKKKKSKDGL